MNKYNVTQKREKMRDRVPFAGLKKAMTAREVEQSGVKLCPFVLGSYEAI